MVTRRATGKRRRRLTDPWAVKPSSPTLYLHSVQRRMMRLQLPILLLALGSSTTAAGASVLYLIGLRVPATAVVILGALYLWLMFMAVAILTGGLLTRGSHVVRFQP